MIYFVGIHVAVHTVSQMFKYMGVYNMFKKFTTHTHTQISDTGLQLLALLLSPFLKTGTILAFFHSVGTLD